MLLTLLFHNENQILAHFMKFLHTSVEDAICVFSAEIVNLSRFREYITENYTILLCFLTILTIFNNFI